MNYYLIDFENVKTDGLKEITGIKENDALIVFYSEQCKNITLDVIDDILKQKIQFSAHKVKTGTKNALDFQLSSHLGYLIGRSGAGSKFYIVSNDKGFDCLCEYWKEQNVAVKRITPCGKEPAKQEKIQPEKTPKKSKVQSSDLATLQEIKEVLSENDEPEEVLKIFNQYKTKQAICNGMSKKFKDSKRTSAIYKKLKPLLKSKNKT